MRTVIMNEREGALVHINCESSSQDHKKSSPTTMASPLTHKKPVKTQHHDLQEDGYGLWSRTRLSWPHAKRAETTTLRTTSTRCNLFVILSLCTIGSLLPLLLSVLFQAQQTNALATAAIPRLPNRSTSHVGKQIKRRSSPVEQMPDSIYKMAPLLFGADIIQDYFTEPKTQARSPGRASSPAKTKPTTARQQANHDRDSFASESVQAQTIRSPPPTPPKASDRKKQPQQKPSPPQRSAPITRTTKKAGSTTTKSPRTIGKQVLQRQMAKLAAKAQSKRLRPAVINTSHMSSLLDTFDTSDTEPVVSKTSGPTRAGDNWNDGPVDLETINKSMGDLQEAIKSPAVMLNEARQMSSESLNQGSPGDASRENGGQEPVTTSESVGGTADQLVEPTSAPAPAVNIANLPNQMSSLLKDITSQQPASQPVSMDQVLSSLGLVIEAMKQQTMAMQMISGQVASDKLATGGKYAQATQASSGPTERPNSTVYDIKPPASGVGAQEGVPAYTTTLSGNTTAGQQITTTEVLSSASQAETRALLESFGELMSGFRGARSAKQFFLDSIGGQLPMAVVQSISGTKTTSAGSVKTSLEGTKGGGGVVVVDNYNEQVMTSKATTVVADTTTSTTTTTTTTPKPTTTTSTTTTTTTTTTPAPTTASTTTTTTPAPTHRYVSTEASTALYTDAVETIPPFVIQMLEKQKKVTPQPLEVVPMKSVSLNYGSGGGGSEASGGGLLNNGWRMVKPVDYYPMQTPPEAISNSLYGGHDDKRSVPLTYSSSSQNLNEYKTQNEIGGHQAYQTMGHMPQMMAQLLMMRQHQHNGELGQYPMVMLPPQMVHTPHQQQHSLQDMMAQMYSNPQHQQPPQQQHMQLPVMINQNQLYQQQQPQQQQHLQQPASEIMMTSPYKQQPQQQPQQQPKVMANIMAAAIAAAAAAEQQQALQQSMHTMQQQTSFADEVPKVPMLAGGGIKRPQPETKIPAGNDNKMQQAAMVAAQMMATMSGGGGSSKGTGQQSAIKIGERPPFDMSNFQLISPVEAGKQKDQQQAMAALMQSAVKELASVQQQQQQQQQQSASASSKQKSSTSESSSTAPSNDLSENASEQVKSPASGKDQGKSNDSDDDEQADREPKSPKSRRPQLVAARPPQQPITSKVTSFSILGGRFKITPHTQMLHAILEPSKQLIKHALSDLISPQSQHPALPMNQQVAAHRKQRPRQQHSKPSASSSGSKSSKSSGSSSTSKSSGKSSASSPSTSSSGSGSQSIKRIQKGVALLATLPLASSSLRPTFVAQSPRRKSIIA